MDKGPMSMCKMLNGISHMPIKPQGDNTAYPPEWLKRNRLIMPSISEDMGRLELLATLAGNCENGTNTLQKYRSVSYQTK